ncbi:MBOAT, membrane-bound O-acyltransferase family [Nesidiocoris tenuis]|uniref:MBOAT, membrane-bound O-acyltransferase family n=1 Tax=Nesidiocoris tenuis TaxID=355587 RepID=A0ABN7AIT4_9HEMI|nr:MBOAT, membrane-bound O-acyltransferase family [Nesidiocoris tenuis]
MPSNPGLDQRDTSDYDWTLWTSLLASLAPWYVAHLVLAESIRKWEPSALPLTHTLVTLSALVVHLPPASAFVIIFVVLLFSFALLVRSASLTWIISVILLISVNVFSEYLFSTYYHSYGDISLTICCFGWFLLKCIDFTLIEIHTTGSILGKFMNLLGYSFYLPCFFLGPFVPYESFKAGLCRTYVPWTGQRFLSLVYSLARVVFWYFAFEMATHFFYCHAMHFKILQVLSLGNWALNGVGLCMAQFFLVKYTVIYGTPLAVARAELYEVPPNPKCVNRIHLYSNMWRHFDRGFYLFLMRCVYKPMCGIRKPSLLRRLAASFVSFCFVFLWHGVNRAMFVWSAMNFVGICLESLGKVFLASAPVSRLISKMNPATVRRLEALACSPMWVMAVLSNYVFFDYDLGMATAGQLFSASGPVLLFVMFIGYCMCQMSIEMFNWDSKKSQLLFQRRR